MGAVRVLAFLAVIVIQGADALSCETIADYSTVADIADGLTKTTCSGGETKCSRPIYKSGDTYETDETWGCKDACKVGASCVLCDTDNCNTIPIQCKDGNDLAAATAATLARCLDEDVAGTMTVQKCIRPKKEYDTWTAGKFECGLCADPAVCLACDDADGCNVPVPFPNGNDGHTCYGYAWDTGKFVKSAAVACKGNDAATTFCNEPTIGAAGLDAASIYNGGCGDCPSGKAGTVCSKCEEASCNNVQQCFTDEANTATALCSVDKCKRPIKDYGGYAAAVSFGCGACTVANLDTTCKECSNADDCNAKVDGTTTKCYPYTWSTDTEKFVKGVSAVCNQGENTKIICNMPKADAVVATYSTLDGCGPCKSGDKCEECNKEDCNGAAMKAATALLFALFYTMI